jgi:hypothetical protein
MTRQQKRKLERTNKKMNMNNIFNESDLQSVGCFYKNDGKDGIGLSQFDPKDSQRIANICERIYRSAMKEVEEGRLTKQQLIDDLKDQLENELIPLFKGDRNIDKLDDEQQDRVYSLVYSDIFSLEKLGGMPTDEYNGMHFMYSKDKLPVFSC